MIDKRLLFDQVEVSLVEGLDEFGKEQYAPSFSLAPVRFDRQLTDFRPGKNPTVNKPGVIFCYTKYCDVEVDSTWINAKIQDGEREYRVVGYIPVYHPLKNKVFCYEVEVL